MASACSLGQPMSARSSACPARLLKNFGKLESWTAAPFPQQSSCFVNSCPAGMLIGPDSQPLALRASESRAPSKLPGLREANEFSCPGRRRNPPPSECRRLGPYRRSGWLKFFCGSQDHHSSLLVSTMVSVLSSYRTVRYLPPTTIDHRHKTRGLGRPSKIAHRAPHCALSTNYQIM